MRLTACLLLLPLAACAGRHPPMYAYWAPRPVPASTVPAYVPDRIDGSYQGTLYLTAAPRQGHRWWLPPAVGDQVCPRNFYGIIEIGDHTLNYAYAPDVIFAAPVQTDGSFSQTVGKATMSGTVHGGRLRLRISTPQCRSRFGGDFKLNHS